ncbi:MAG: alpha-L-arabinofuranosidase C-terminal domain-containing protein [Terriglobia bacterium]
MKKLCSVLIGFAVLPLAILAANAQSVSTYISTDSQSARIEIDAAKTTTFRIPRTIYGTFLEDIGHSVFGGVSSQLLDNPSFESYDASLRTLNERFSSPEFMASTQRGLPLPWLPLRASQGWRYEPRWGRATNSSRYLYLMGMADQEVGIRQTIYIPIERQKDYEGIIFASSEDGSLALELSFRRKNAADVVLASAKVDIAAESGWHKLHFRLSLPAGAVAPLEPVDFVISIQGNHRVSIDEVRLYPADATDGLDPEVIRAAKALHTSLLRYGGNFTSGYHWEDGVGPLDTRPTKLNQAWGYPEYNEFGTDELMNFCDGIGARAQICLNLGSGTVEEARRWVEYCQGSSSTPEGQFRAANGHAEPYDVAAWELGNELWGHFQTGWQTPQGYADRYLRFYNAIRSLLPKNTMLFANGADIDFFHDWNGALITRDGSSVDFLTSHLVVGMDRVRDKQMGRDAIWRADFAVPVGVGRALEPVEAQVNRNPETRDRVKLAYTEWLFTAADDSPYPRWDNLGGAINAAAWMSMLLRHADFVKVSDMTGLLEFGGIYKRFGRVYVTPQYWAFWLYSNRAGDTPVATQTTVREYDVHNGVNRVPDIAQVPWLDVLATTDSRRHDLVLFVVNRDWTQAIPADLEIGSFKAAKTARVETLTSDSILSRNDAFHPSRVQPVTSHVEVPGNTLRYTFPPRSLTVVSFSAQ